MKRLGLLFLVVVALLTLFLWDSGLWHDLGSF